MKDTRPIIWLKAADKVFTEFPQPVRDHTFDALTLVAAGAMPVIAKVLKGLGSGVWELRLNDRSGTYRVVYALQLGAAIYVVHAFQKKSKTGIATPKAEIDLIAHRIKRLKEELKHGE